VGWGRTPTEKMVKTLRTPIVPNLGAPNHFSRFKSPKKLRRSLVIADHLTVITAGLPGAKLHSW
jgi:hypothetical protein